MEMSNLSNTQITCLIIFLVGALSVNWNANMNYKKVLNKNQNTEMAKFAISAGY